MEQGEWSPLLATLVRILTLERGAAGRGAILEEAKRLIEEDPDFRYLAENWREPRLLQPRIGARSDSLDDLRAEAEQLRLFEKYPAQQIRYEVLTSGTFALVLWVGLAAALDSKALEGFPLALQIPVVAFAFGVGAFFAWGIATTKSRDTFYKILKPDLFKHRWWGLLPLAGLLLVILMFATLGFAGLSELLYLHGIATTDRALADPLFASQVFYVWSFLNAIPVLEIPQTLRWELHFEFTDHVNPVLLLAYKIAVIAPVIATARLAWSARRVIRP